MTKFKEVFKYLNSEPYKKAAYDNAKKLVYLNVFFAQLFSYGLIDEDHYLWYLGMIDTAGYFMVSKKNLDHLAELESKLHLLVVDKPIKKVLWGEGKK